MSFEDPNIQLSAFNRYLGKYLKFLPHERIIYESPEEIEAGYNIKRKVDAEHVDEIREVRDEANRPWWKWFDEYEYRHTKDDASKIVWWSWYEKDAPKEEKKLLLKLDILITLAVFIGYWCKSLDQNNLNNAYVSGMKEDLNLQGNALINLQVIFLVAGVIFEVPMAYVLPRFPPVYVLFIAELFWSLFTLVSFRAPNLAALQAFRFLIGASEAAFFPIVHHLFANWYKPTEVSSRAGFFYFGLYLGNLTSGLLQSAIHINLDGVHGLEGWRWMFLIDGLTSFGITLLTFFAIPGTPFKCYSLWLTDDEVKLARKRMRARGLDEKIPTKKDFLSWKAWKHILTSWHFWVLSVGNIGGFLSNSASSGSFALWLKSLNKYSVGKLNNLTAIPPALGILYIIVICFGADIVKKRFLMIAFSQLMNMIGNVVLAVWDVPDGAKWFGYCFGYWSWSQSSTFYPLQNDILRRDANTRAIEWVISQVFAAQFYAWISRLLFPTVDAPRFHKGFTGAACFSVLQALSMFVAQYFYKIDEKNYSYENGIVVYNSAKGETLEEAEAEFYRKISDARNKLISESEKDASSDEFSDDVDANHINHEIKL